MSWRDRDWRGFWAEWASRIKSRMGSLLGGLAIFASIASFIGYTLTEVDYLRAATLGFLIIVFMLVITCIPHLPYSDEAISDQDDNLRELNRIIHRYKSFCLVGVQDVGKTTFLNGLLNRAPPSRGTRIPYFRRIKVDTRKGSKFAIFIDTVGESREVQLNSQSFADIAVFIFDHAAGVSLEEVDEQRLASHRSLAKDLADSRDRKELGPSKILLVPNKADLWKTDEVRERMNTFTAELKSELLGAQAYPKVFLVKPISIRSTEGSAEVLSELGDIL